ncbi:hypothetical protein COJ23_22210 [Priestia megaterium]|uniref:hypothetical protein n=1 Tax=Priestia megaterium TaxID=1404 RepID=UPI000BF7260D|nr:hypothetical protein [Priestia megaterium]PFK46721.1 hypothetical protein COJ23_22210 [Priestia megaterium]
MTILDTMENIKGLIIAFYHSKWLQSFASAVLAAGFTQWLNNRLTRTRENDKRLQDGFKEFYNKIVPEIYDYFSIETDFRKGHDLKENVNPKQMRERILETISDNMIHVNSEVHTAYRKVIKNKYFDDYSGFHSRVDDINLLYVVVNEYIKLLEKSKYKNTKSHIQYACLLLIWKYTVESCQSYGAAYAAISKNFYFDTRKLNKKTLKQLESLEKIENKPNEHSASFKKILCRLLGKQDMSMKEKKAFLNDFLENDHENVDTQNHFENFETFQGLLTIEQRAQFRDYLLAELYSNKYEPIDPPKYEFIFNDESLEGTPNELKNAINYLKEKGMVRFKTQEGFVKLILTADGEDHYEKEIYLENI